MISYTNFLPHIPVVRAFFDQATNTVTYVVSDPNTNHAAIIDSVLDYEPQGATLSYKSADALIAYVETEGLTIDWILETHVHADHLTAAQYLKEKLGGKTAIGKDIVAVQHIFSEVFALGDDFMRDGSQFDRLWNDDDEFTVGNIPARVLHVPGHTPADVAYVIGNAVFVGDTLFMPDFGTARCDFPGGSAATMYASSKRLFELPDDMRMFMCHDYLPEGRNEYAWETTVGAQKRENIHVHSEVSSTQFIEMRTARDAQLGMPKLIIPAIQVNINAGKVVQDVAGRIFFKIPVNSAFSQK